MKNRTHFVYYVSWSHTAAASKNLTPVYNPDHLPKELYSSAPLPWYSGLMRPLQIFFLVSSVHLGPLLQVASCSLSTLDELMVGLLGRLNKLIHVKHLKQQQA